MDNKIKKLDPKDGIKGKQHRKENGFYQQYSLVDIGHRKEIMIVRFYATEARIYCCLWGLHDLQFSGSGYAGGYGYHKASAAMQSALDSAGVVMDRSIDGVGDSAIEGVLECFGQKYCSEYMIVKANA